jgi:hypothetical protein
LFDQNVVNCFFFQNHQMRYMKYLQRCLWQLVFFAACFLLLFLPERNRIGFLLTWNWLPPERFPFLIHC